MGPHGGNLLNLAFMRQPGTHGVADWTDVSRVGDWKAMGADGDPIPAVRLSSSCVLLIVAAYCCLLLLAVCNCLLLLVSSRPLRVTHLPDKRVYAAPYMLPHTCVADVREGWGRW